MLPDYILESALWGPLVALGVLVAAEEGLEINVLGLVFGIDFARPALKLPGVGRLGFPRRG